MSRAVDPHRVSIDRLMDWLVERRRQHPKQTLSVLLADQAVESSQLIDLACIDLMVRTRMGQVACAEDYLDQFPQLKNESSVLDLIDAELCVARELGHPVDVDAVAARFPMLAEQVKMLAQMEPTGSANLVHRQTGSELGGAGSDRSLGGYRIIRLLGRGAMGEVYEAKQVSLDRMVALKMIRGRLASNPASLARFTREAYAAAQLVHHNVVQIYDFGEDRGRLFFSMEWVRGGPLESLIRTHGALDARLAAGYTLQAARGLLFAHRNGMVHRDVKPANLLLSQEGIVKVADLGLVKIPDPIDPASGIDAGSSSGRGGETDDTSDLVTSGNVTMQGTAVGTPAYMAPEQNVDARGVDHRADIYSLGCTLFYLLAGRPPFESSDVADLLEQHLRDPLPRLGDINASVPDELRTIVERATAKRPEDRYPSLAEMITDLQSFLGRRRDGTFAPTTDQADQWESIAGHHENASRRLQWADPLIGVWIAVATLLSLLASVASLDWLLLGPSAILASIVTALAFQARSGRSVIVDYSRAWIGSLGWIDLCIGAMVALALLSVVMLTAWFAGLFAGVLLGMVAGAGYHFGLVKPVIDRKRDVLATAKKFIRDLRIDGANEEGLRSFAARYAGKGWQSLFEDLFGYEALGAMRSELRADSSFLHSTNASVFRDALCARLAARSKSNRLRRDHARLAQIEQRGLQSEGIDEAAAREQAWQIAAAVIDTARITSATPIDAAAAAEAKRARMKEMLADARSGKYKIERPAVQAWKLALGSQTRLLGGCCLLAVFAVWGNNVGLFEPLKQVGGNISLDEVESALRGTAETAEQTDAGTEILGSNTSAWSIGVAGVFLTLSAFVSGWRMTPFAAVATIVILFGPAIGIPGIGIPGTDTILAPWMTSTLAGFACYLPGMVWGETNETSRA